jgi:ATP adenylyltransferase
LQYLFAPWRFAYVSQADSPGGCIFCAAARNDADGLTVARSDHAFALLNRYPYTSGHTMVAPYAHLGDLSELDNEALVAVMRLAQRVVRALRQVYQPHGFNVGFNLGEAAGAGIAEHLHLHIVPRWRGDTSFMTVNAEVRVLPEALEETRVKLRRALEADGG